MRPSIDLDDAGDVTVVVRTDYSDEAAWRGVVAALRAPAADGHADVHHFVDDPGWQGADRAEVVGALPPEAPVVFIADERAMREPFPLLAVDPEAGEAFRVLPAGVADVSANLAIANMDFWEFAAVARDDPDGWYRGIDAVGEEAAPRGEAEWDGWSPGDRHRLSRGRGTRTVSSPRSRELTPWLCETTATSTSSTTTTAPRGPSAPLTTSVCSTTCARWREAGQPKDAEDPRREVAPRVGHPFRIGRL